MAIIPPSLQQIFEPIKEQVLLLILHWTVYQTLFNRSGKRFKMLQSCDEASFWCIQTALETEILMSMSRLADSPGSGMKKHLCFEALHQEITKCGQGALAKKLRKARKDIRRELAGLKEHRDTRLAHNARRIFKNPSPIKHSITAKMIQQAISSFEEYMATFENHFSPDTEFKYEAGLFDRGEGLVHVVKNGLRFREMVNEGVIDHRETRKGAWADA